ncbi:hypothetical protein V5O48_013346 [Marasmius crinis-equi]|uniref:Uncharacterized protein n=1 Tax=Marasmius crinis-equi TaxID=585013 RepID=A0ABR3F0C0_9AGAR
MSRLVRRNVTMLSRLHLELSQCTPDPMSGTLDAFAIAPQLVHLTLLGPTIFTASELLCLPWSQITHFRGSSMSMLTEAANNYEFLHKMSSLKAFMDHRSFAADWNGLAAIDVPSLEVLSLFSLNRTASNISLLLDHLNAVHLRDLRISTNPHTESLLRFTRRSAASLRSMTLALRDSDVSKTIELLECVPDLHTLLIYEGSFELIRCLGDYDPQRQAPRLLPKLHTLRIFGSQISHRAHEALLLEIAESRVAPAPDLSSSITQTNTGSNYLCVLELDVNIGIRQEALDALGMYHSRGLKTHLSHAKYFFQFN